MEREESSKLNSSAFFEAASRQAGCLTALDFEILRLAEGDEVAMEILMITIALNKEDAMTKITH